jgi:hypothetical protein
VATTETAAATAACKSTATTAETTTTGEATATAAGEATATGDATATAREATATPDEAAARDTATANKSAATSEAAASKHRPANKGSAAIRGAVSVAIIARAVEIGPTVIGSAIIGPAVISVVVIGIAVIIRARLPEGGGSETECQESTDQAARSHAAIAIISPPIMMSDAIMNAMTMSDAMMDIFCFKELRRRCGNRWRRAAERCSRTSADERQAENGTGDSAGERSREGHSHSRLPKMCSTAVGPIAILRRSSARFLVPVSKK